jgi:hypothetical protein
MTTMATAVRESHRLQLAVRGQSIRYTRKVGGPGSVVDLLAVRGSTDHQVSDSAGALAQYTSADWIALAATLAAGPGGVAFEPAEGDTIDELDALGGTPTGIRYEVSPYAGGAAWKRDATRTVYRIHATEIP